MPTLDALRPATADSFSQAADLLRAPRPPRPARAGRRKLAAVAALVVAVGACAYPVESERTVGHVIEWTTYGSVSPANYTVEAFDRWVPPRQRLAVETYATDRPALPPDHDWPAGGSWTRLRYAVGTTNAATARAWADSLGAVVGAYDVRLEPLVQTERVPLGTVAAGRVGLGVSPSDPTVSDAELQAYIDRVDSRNDSERPRVDRLSDGRRILNYQDRSAFVVAPGSRLWVRLDETGQRRLAYSGFGEEDFLLKEDGQWRSGFEVMREEITEKVDSLARAGSSDPVAP